MQIEDDSQAKTDSKNNSDQEDMEMAALLQNEEFIDDTPIPIELPQQESGSGKTSERLMC